MGPAPSPRVDLILEYFGDALHEETPPSGEARCGHHCSLPSASTTPSGVNESADEASGAASSLPDASALLAVASAGDAPSPPVSVEI